MSDSETAWHDVAAAAEVPPGAIREVVAGDRMVALANIDGELLALDGICAHQGGPIGKGKLEGGCITCPWHGWQYDARTGRQLLSKTIAQQRFAVRIAGDRIVVCLDPPHDSPPDSV